LSASHYTAAQGRTFYRELRRQLEGLPGARAVSYAEDVPLGFDGGSWEDIEIDGYVPQPAENMKIYRNLIGPGYFELMRIPLVDGRDFRDADDPGATPVVIVNESFARRFLPGRNPLGSRLRGWGRELTIVGVAKDSKYRSLGGRAEPYLYFPFAQFYGPSTGMAMHLRTTVAPESLLPAVRRVVRQMDPNVAVFVALSLKDYIGAAYFMQKIAATLLSALGLMALVLAALGLYSVMAYSVAQRTQEFGVRLALGAQPGDLLRLVVGQGARLAALGLLVGALGALAAARLISSSLYGTSPADPVVFAGVAGLLAVIALAACYFPARRAANVDPIQALREE
jgi:predicted permease